MGGAKNADGEGSEDDEELALHCVFEGFEDFGRGGFGKILQKLG